MFLITDITKEKTDGRFPESFGECADLLYNIRKDRLALQKEVDALQERETALKTHLLRNLPESGQTGASGKTANVQMKVKIVPQVTDWDAFYSHIKASGELQLLDRRVSLSAVRDHWDNGEDVAGVTPLEIDYLSITKLA